MKKTITFFCVLFASMSLMAQLAGSGTQASPYQISNYSDLVYMSTCVNENSVPISPNTEAYPSAWYQLTADIDASASGTAGSEFNPIGFWTTGTINTFKGVFDGNRKTITNLTATRAVVATAGYAGFFGALGSNAVIKDLTLIGLTISQTFLERSGFAAGGLVGLIYIPTGENVANVTINNCSVSGNLSYTSTTTSAVTNVEYNIGGLLGAMVNTTNVLIINSSANMAITLNLSLAADNKIFNLNCGGLVGRISTTEAKIVNCFATGSINVNGGTFGALLVGGIAGGIQTNQATKGCYINNCYATNSIYVTNPDGEISGATKACGILGNFVDAANNSSVINNCYALNPSIRVTGYPIAINRILNTKTFAGTSLTLKNYALSSMSIQFGSSPLTDVTLLTKGDTEIDGQDIADLTTAKTGLNNEISSMPAYTYLGTNLTSAITLKPWTVSGLKDNIFYDAVKYAVANGCLTIKAIEGSTNALVSSIIGKQIAKLNVSSDCTIKLPKGVYIVSVKGFAPTKVLIP